MRRRKPYYVVSIGDVEGKGRALKRRIGSEVLKFAAGED
jgi:hypothetical protein